MKQLPATCWILLLLHASLWEPALCRGGGRGGSRGSSRGSAARSSPAGSYRTTGTRSRFSAPGRTSPVRVASAAAAGAAVALAADGWYASAFRRSGADSSEEDEPARSNWTEYLMSGSTRSGSFLSEVVHLILATFPTNSELLLDFIL